MATLDFSLIDKELERQGVDPAKAARLLNFNNATTNGATNAPPVSATTAQPGTLDYNLRVGATSQPRVNFAAATPAKPEAPDMGAPALSAGRGLNFGAAPSPMKPAAPRREDFPVEKRPGWKNLLGAAFSVMAGARDPNQAGATAREFFGEPKAEAERKFQRASQEYQTEDERGRQQRAEAAQAEKEQFATPQGREQYMAQNPERFAGITDFEKNDWVLSGKFPQREPAAAKLPEAEQAIQDHLAATNRQDTPANRDAARGELAERSKTAGQADKTDKKIDEFVNPQGQRVNVMQRPDGTTYNATRGEVRPEAGTAKTQDVKDIADGIAHGIDPPDMTKYGYRDRTAIAAELKRQGFDLSRAQQDWTATQKHLSTLNGAQQERLRQAITFTNDSLGIIQDLYTQWKATGLPSGFKVYNRAALVASSNLPGRAGSVAQRLMAQINDLTSELGTVYKGGNTSTDESLRLAAENLKAEWNDRTFTDALAQVRKNLQIRQNSITHSQPAGVSANSPYTPPAERPGAGDLGPAPAGKAEGSTGTLPDGTKVVVRGGRIVAQ